MRTILIFLAVVANGLCEPKENKFLESYTGQSTEELIALASNHRIDSIVLAFEQAIDEKQAKGRKLSQAEIDLVAVEAMEREVNNGGYHVFFVNSSKRYARVLQASLMRIGCPVAAKIAADALATLRIDGEVTEAKIDSTLERLGEKAVTDLREMDERYFKNDEPIADRLFAYIRAKKSEVILK